MAGTLWLRSSGLLAPLAAASVISVLSGATIGDINAPDCRSLATELTAQVTAGVFSASIKTSCTFDPSKKQSHCTSRYSDNQGTSTTSTTTSTYNSVADVIDEIAVIPPLSYAISTSAEQSGNRGGKTTGSVVNTFESNRRIVKTVNTSSGGESTTTYTAWDAAGRPTRATDVGKGFSNVRTISYDDAAHTRTTIVNSGPVRTMETFDANGNQIDTISSGGGAPLVTKTTVTISSSQRVCK